MFHQQMMVVNMFSMAEVFCIEHGWVYFPIEIMGISLILCDIQTCWLSLF